jgi:hypothetical protein
MNGKDFLARLVKCQEALGSLTQERVKEHKWRHCGYLTTKRNAIEEKR